MVTIAILKMPCPVCKSAHAGEHQGIFALKFVDTIPSKKLDNKLKKNNNKKKKKHRITVCHATMLSVQ